MDLEKLNEMIAMMMMMMMMAFLNLWGFFPHFVGSECNTRDKCISAAEQKSF